MLVKYAFGIILVLAQLMRGGVILKHLSLSEPIHRMTPALCLVFGGIMEIIRLLRGTFVSQWYLSRICPSVTEIQHYYHARYPTDDWHLAYMFSLVYFFVEACLKACFPIPLALGEIPASGSVQLSRWLTPHEKTKSNSGDTALHLSQVRGNLNWRMGLPALLGGNLGCWIF